MPKILIVDDSLMSRMLIGAIVNQVYPDADIIEAEDGDDALGKIQDQEIDIATVDLNMPGMDAFDLVDKLKQEHPAIRIGLLTANVQPEVRKKADELKLEFLAKPISEESVSDFLLEMN